MMINQIKFNFFALLVCFCLGLASPSKAQTLLNSPYSYLRMGELNQTAGASLDMMGGLGVATSNAIYTNMVNPALLARNRYTVFEVGAKTTFKVMQDLRQKQRSFGGNYEYLSLAFPVSNRWTANISMRPYSEVNYETQSLRRLSPLGLDSLIYSFRGEGNVNRISIANGFRIAKELYLGLEMNYLFGNVSRGVSTQNLADGQYYKVQLENRNYYNNVYFKSGLAYRFKLGTDLYLSLGATLDMTKNINAKSLRRFATYDLSGLNLINADTLENMRGYTQALPVSKKVGINLEKIAKWSIGLDYIETDWSRLTNNLGNSQGLNVSRQWVLGGEFTPDFGSVTNYWKRVTYRFGLNAQTTAYRLNANDPAAKEQFVTFGMALPLRNLSYLNLSYQLGKRGSIDANRLEEQFQRITLGFTFSDVWFVKQKIN